MFGKEVHENVKKIDKMHVIVFPINPNRKNKAEGKRNMSVTFKGVYPQYYRIKRNVAN